MLCDCGVSVHFDSLFILAFTDYYGLMFVL